MKRLFILFFAVSVISCLGESEQESKLEPVAVGDTADLNKVIEDTTKYTTIKWDKTEVNFGVIKAGEKAIVKYTFTNTGDKPLFLTNVTAACGCTVPSYTKGAVPPGGSGEVTGEYNSTGNSGAVSKYITVISNTKPENMQRLIFTGEVKQ